MNGVVDTRVNLIPEWVKADVFLDLLKKEVPNFEKVKNFKTAPALLPGENYATLMIRVDIDVELKDTNIEEKSYMMKLPIPHQLTDQLSELGNIFQLEQSNLNEILPELEKLYRDVGIDIKFGPTAHALPNVENDYVLMDDLAKHGYKNVKRTAGFDLNHMETVLEKLAKYHAASAVRVATKGSYPKVYLGGFNEEARATIFENMIMSFKDSFLNHIKTFKDGAKYETSVKRFFDNVPTIIRLILAYDQSGFNVLIHGDFWCNNIMFKYDDANEIDDIIFVDFQMPRWGPPVLDLLYLIISSAQFEIKLSKFEYFITFYYNHLIANLKLLKYPNELPLLRNLFIQLLKYGEFGFLTAIMTMAGVLLDSSDKANMENLISDSADGKDFRSALYSNERYHTHINELLPWLYNHGILTNE